mgnify:CR=1 FL=1
MRAIFLLVLLILGKAVAAQVPATPVNIEADMLEFQQEKGIYIARGNALVQQGGVTIKADLLTAYSTTVNKATQFTQVHAQGNVHITSDKGDVFGERGVYDVARNVAVLKGANLRLVTPTDVITARDSLEYWQSKQLAVARGAAQAKRGDNLIQADLLTALLSKDSSGKQDVRRVGAEGHVTIITPQETARGDKGIYDVKWQLATLDGNVRITRGDNQLNGARAEVNMASGVSRLLAGQGQRVRGLLVPKDAPEVP